MGVPGLFSWIKRSCPETIAPFGVEERVSREGCDNLYLDLNHIVHGCTHTAFHCKSSDEADVREAFDHVKAYVVRLVRLAAPRKLLFLAVDGVGPRAKMNQQRGRRFLSAYTREQSARIEREIRANMDGEAKRKLLIDPLPDFDSNIITPGTPFMELLSALLEELVLEQLDSNPAWKDLLVILSTAAEPGEGEHKIMRFIRHQRCLPGYNPNLRHVIIGQDGDLILLSLLTHEPHFEIIREDMHEAGKGLMPLMKLRIGVLRRYLKKGLEELIELQEKDGTSDLDEEDAVLAERDGKKTEMDSKTFERMIDDFVFLTFMVGNDFLPSIPSLDIYDRGGGLDLLMHAYKCMRKKDDGFITDQGLVNFARLKKLLLEVAKDEEESYKRKERHRQYAHKKVLDEIAAQKADDSCMAKGDSCFGDGGWISVGEIHSGKDIDDALGMDFGRSCSKWEGDMLADLTKEDLQEELSGRLKQRIEDLLLEGNKADPIRLGIKGYRERYYQTLFGATSGDGIERTSRKICEDYFKGLAWVFAYYVRGNNPVATSEGSLVFQEEEKPKEQRKRGKGRRASEGFDGPLYASWDWFYPHYYAPLMQDMVKFTGDSTKVRNKALRAGSLDLDEYDKGKLEPRHGPVLPLIQLMSVVPPRSAPACLPRKLANILQSASTAAEESDYSLSYENLSDMFPEDVGKLLDARDKRFAHTVIVKLPFSNPEKLAKAVTLPSQEEEELTIEEENRNRFSPAQLFFHKDSKMSKHLDEGALDVPDQEGLLLPLLVDGGDEDNEANEETDDDIESSAEAPVLVASIDIAGASTEAFVSELLPGVNIDSTPLGKAMFRLPLIARSHAERAGKPGEGQRGRGMEGRGSGMGFTRGRSRGRWDSAGRLAESGRRGLSNRRKGHFMRNGAGRASGSQAQGQWGRLSAATSDHSNMHNSGWGARQAGFDSMPGASSNTSLALGWDEGHSGPTTRPSHLQEDVLWAVTTERTEWGLDEIPQVSHSSSHENGWTHGDMVHHEELHPLHRMGKSLDDKWEPELLSSSREPGCHSQDIPPESDSCQLHQYRNMKSSSDKSKPPGYFNLQNSSGNSFQGRGRGRFGRAKSTRKDNENIGALGFMESVRRAHR